MFSQGRFLTAAILLAAALVAVPAARAQYVQQGGKLVGSGAVLNGTAAFCDPGSAQGSATALSTDGNTAIIGGDGDNSGNGAVWVFTRSGGTWSQQGGKLIGRGGINTQDYGVCQGFAVAVSGDGNTLISGGYADNQAAGSAWIFTRANGTWQQQGLSLQPDDTSIAEAYFGISVALSSDGQTAAVGGSDDYSADQSTHSGAVWVFTQNNGTWFQQGSKLVADTDNVPSSAIPMEGHSVALSSDGNTLIEGGPEDCLDSGACAGAVAVFTRANGQWTQQGRKFGVANSEFFGWSVALSADGNTALIGDYGADAAYVFTRSGGVWTLQSKLSGSGDGGAAQQGYSVALSADGNTALVGGPQDSPMGAAWVFKRSGGVWSQLGGKLTGSGSVSGPLGVQQGTSVALSADGSTALVGGIGDNNNTGATWVFVPGVSGAATPVGVSPASGSASSQSMVFTFTDPRGSQDLDIVNVLINNFLDGRNACYLAYSRTSSVLYLLADNGGTLQPLTLNGSGSVSNSQCTVAGAGSSVNLSGNNLALTLNLTFSAAFAGNKVTYMAARDLEGDNSGWGALGTWGVPGLTTFPAAVGVSPARTTGSSQTFIFTFSDTKGVTDLGVVNVLINNFLDGRQACYVAYSQPFKVLYLVGDAGGGLSSGLTLGGSGNVSNSQCTVNSAGSSASGTGNTLTLTLNISFTAGFDGNRVIYLAARDSTGANNYGWQALGSLTIQ